MGRNRKTGLDYFPFDIDTFQDIKIRKLIKYQSGKAVTVYALLLCLIYKGGYYMRWDEELPFIISEQTGFEEAYIQEVIKSCMILGLFSKEMFDAERVLTSKGIQERYRDICKQMNRKCDFVEFSLISSEEKAISSEEIPIYSEETRINSEKIPQKKIKGKKKEISPDGDTKKGEPSGSSLPPGIADNAEKELSECRSMVLSDRYWMETVCMNEHLTPETFTSLIEEFFKTLQNRGELRKSVRDAKHHFASWLKIELKNRNNHARNRSSISKNQASETGYGEE